jgi:hypothetical protein
MPISREDGVWREPLRLLDRRDALVGRANVVTHQPKEHGEQIRRVPVVVGDEDSQPGDGRFVAARSRHEHVCRFRHHRKMDDELAALADAFAAGFDPAAMRLDEPTDQRESDPESALGALERAVRLPGLQPNLPSCRSPRLSVHACGRAS